MKILTYNSYQLMIWTLIAIISFMSSCGQKKLPSELEGSWETDWVPIAVRSQPEKGNYEFNKDTVIVTLKINSDYTAEGSIGSASFENAKIKKRNRQHYDFQIAYTIKCNTKGKFFISDPLENKSVELRLGAPQGNMEAFLFTRRQKFPMGYMVFTKKKN